MKSRNGVPIISSSVSFILKPPTVYWWSYAKTFNKSVETTIILETPRLLLREFTMRDAKHLFELNGDPEVIRYVGDGAFASLTEAEKFVANYDQYERYGMGRWAVDT
jgi:RimJ/RimL family protein N-acetyltransferase